MLKKQQSSPIQPSPKHEPMQYTYTDEKALLLQDESNGNLNHNCRNINLTLEKTDEMDEPMPDNINTMMSLSTPLIYPPTLFSSNSSIDIYGDH